MVGCKLKKFIVLGIALAVFGASFVMSYEAKAQAGGYARSGGEVGSGGGESGYGNWNTDVSGDGMYGSCASAIGALQRALRMARYQNGNFAQTRRVLTQGLANALAQIPERETPLTKSALRRGLTLNQQFVGGCRNAADPTSKAQCLDLEQRTAVFFLDRFYSYIINSVYPLDTNYWIPYRTQYPRCRSYACLPSNFYSSFYVAYKDSARELLDFYIGHGHNGMPDALAMDVYELRVAEHVLKWASTDLNLDLFRRGFQCVVSDLAVASQDLADFNSGSTMIFRNSRQAVNFARDTAYANASALSGYVCGYRY